MPTTLPWVSITAPQWLVHEAPEEVGARTNLCHGQLRAEKGIQTHEGLRRACAL